MNNNTMIKFLGRGIILPELLDELSKLKQETLNSELRKINSEFRVNLVLYGTKTETDWYQWYQLGYKIRLYRGGSFIREEFGPLSSTYDPEEEYYYFSQWEEYKAQNGLS